MANAGLWGFFILFGIAAVGTLIYAIQSLGSTRDAEERILELQEEIEDEE